MEHGFKEWAEKRGVWPRLTHEEIWDAAVKTEREACAKVCELLAETGWQENPEYGAYDEFTDAVNSIRKRSNV